VTEKAPDFASIRPDLDPPEAPFEAREGRILHVTRRSLPMDATANSRDLHELVKAECAEGLDSSVVTELGFLSEKKYTVDQFAGVDYRRIPGRSRGTIADEKWLNAFTQKLATVIRKVRPAALVAHSDPAVRLAASAVGSAYGIPTVLSLERLQDVDSQELTWLHEFTVIVAFSEAVAKQLGSLGVSAADYVTSADYSLSPFLKAYETAGIITPGTAEVAAIQARPSDLDFLHKEVGRSGGVPLESEWTGPRGHASRQENVWRLNELIVDLRLPLSWRDLCLDNRSHGFHLHAWEFMNASLGEYSLTGDLAPLKWCLRLAASWCEAFSVDDKESATMAWYDMALAARAPKLSFLLQEALRHDMGGAFTELLHASVVQHQKAIFAPGAFAVHNNHGFYTAFGELSFARRLRHLPAMDLLWDQGSQRMRAVATRQFAEDGGHLEHSPDYHRMLVDSFLSAIETGLVDDPEVKARVQRAQWVLDWFVQPDGTIVQIGDSAAKRVRRREASIARPGQHDQPCPSPQQSLLVLPTTGYVVVRDEANSEKPADHAYLTLMAGFHSRTHKHADDLSLTWFDGGGEVLIDSGRFGYLDLLPPDSPLRLEGFFYGRPERQYVEGTRAHNTVEVDGRSHERRNRRPYGSAIVSADQIGARFVACAEVDHGTWHHRREIVLHPGRWLCIRDILAARDEQRHDFRAWWNLAEKLALESVDGDDMLRFGREDGGEITVRSFDDSSLVLPVRGQVAPLRGWRSKQDGEFTPAWSFACEATNRQSHTFDTAFMLDGTYSDEARSAFDSLSNGACP
jgi:hypothetical protein